MAIRFLRRCLILMKQIKFGLDRKKRCNMKIRLESTLFLVFLFAQVLHLTQSTYQLTTADQKDHRSIRPKYHTIGNDEKSSLLSILLGAEKTTIKPKSDDDLKLNLKQIMNNSNEVLNKTINSLVKDIIKENQHVAYKLDDSRTFFDVYLGDCYDPTFDGQKLNVFKMSIRQSLNTYFGSKSMETMLKFHKLGVAEQKKRKRVLKKNMQRMMKLVLECVLKVRPKTKYGLTSVSHLSRKEFKQMQGFRLNDANRAKVKVKKYREDYGDEAVPETFDAREKGFSTSVKNQGQTCGSCFIFTAMSALENQYLMINEGKVKPEEIDYSEQAVLDCMEPGTCRNGGLASFVYEYLMSHDIVDEETAPYRGQQGRCKQNLKKSKHACKVTKHATFEGLNKNDPETIQRRVIKFGAAYMAICGDDPALQHLRGKFSGPCCTTLSHAVTLIGWDKEYWIIKNSWGPNWGEEGYLYLPRQKNKCGFGKYAAIVYTEGCEEHRNSTTTIPTTSGGSETVTSDGSATTKSSSDSSDSTGGEITGGKTTGGEITDGGTTGGEITGGEITGGDGTTKPNSETTTGCPCQKSTTSNPDDPTGKNTGDPNDKTTPGCPCQKSTTPNPDDPTGKNTGDPNSKTTTICPPDQPTPKDSTTKCPCNPDDSPTTPASGEVKTTICDEEADQEIDRYIEQIAKKNKHVAKTIKETQRLQRSVSGPGLSHCYDPEFHGEHFNMFELSPDQAIKKYLKMKPIKNSLKFIRLADSAKEEKVQILTENMKEITKLVLDCVSRKRPKTRFGLTSVSHLSREEFRHLLGFRLANSSAVARVEPYNEDLGNDEIPRTFDWRHKGYVTPVKNQMACSSCFIFSAIGMAESQFLLMKNGKVQAEDVDLSEQAVLNCMEPFTCERGGFPGFAYDFLRQNDAVDEETEPYTGRQGTCNTRLPKTRLSLKVGKHQDYIGIEKNSQETMQRRIMKYGPVNGAICASYDFQFLRDKYHGNCCKGLNHAVLIVGWTEEYWIIKNSWGTRWGLENGYLYLPRQKDKCGIQQFTCVLNLADFHPSNDSTLHPKPPAHRTTKSGKHSTKKPPAHRTTKSVRHSTKRPPAHHTTKSGKHSTKKPPAHRTTKSVRHSTKRPPSHHTTKSGKHSTKKPPHHHTTKSGRRSTKKSPTTKCGRHSSKRPPSHHHTTVGTRKRHTTKKIRYPTKKPKTWKPPKHHTTPRYKPPTNKPRTRKPPVHYPTGKPPVHHPTGKPIRIDIVIHILVDIRKNSKYIDQALKDIETMKEKVQKAQKWMVEKCYDSTFDGQTVDLIKTPLEDVLTKIFGMDSVQLALNKQGETSQSPLKKSIQSFIVNVEDTLKLILKCVEKNLNTTFGLTSLSIFDKREFKSMLGYRAPFGIHPITRIDPYDENLGDDEIPEAFDWRDHYSVTPIRDQGRCASCFVFSSVAAAECQYLIMHNTEVRPDHVDLSEQAVLDCMAPNSCHWGGWPAHVYDFLTKHNFVDEETKPYYDGQGRCNTRLKKTELDIKVKSYQDSFGPDRNTQENIQRKIMKFGPVNAAMCLSDDMQALKGKYDGQCCYDLNHLVLLIGWDKDYWIAKNSFSTNWGVDGFFYLLRKKENNCGIQEHINYVILEGYDPDAPKNTTSGSNSTTVEPPDDNNSTTSASDSTTEDDEEDTTTEDDEEDTTTEDDEEDTTTEDDEEDTTTEDDEEDTTTEDDEEDTTTEDDEEEDTTEEDTTDETTECPCVVQTTNSGLNSTNDDPGDRNSTKSDSETSTQDPCGRRSTKSSSDSTKEDPGDGNSTKSDSETSTQDPCGRRSTKSGSNSTKEEPPNDKNSTKSGSDSTTDEPSNEGTTGSDSETSTQDPCGKGSNHHKGAKWKFY